MNIPSFQVTQYDIIDVREKSLQMTPFIVARETHGERVVPGWMDAFPERMRILVHQLPTREQIDIPVTEQLIVDRLAAEFSGLDVARAGHPTSPMRTFVP